MELKPAVFLDRDGTLIEHVHHLARVEDVRLVPGAGRAVRELTDAGFACVLVTNQSVVGRGIIDVPQLERIHDEMHAQLEAEEARLAGVYFCPLAPTQTDDTVIEHPDRKPGPGMLQRAAKELSLDLQRSWMIGDSMSDILAGRNAGCRESLLVLTGFGAKVLARGAYTGRHATSLVEAARLVLSASEHER